MNEIIFLVEEVDGGKYVTTAIGRAISIRANSWDELKSSAKKEVLDFFKNGKPPQSILFHLTREETLSLES